MAPEMKKDGKIKYDKRIDIYALGKLMLKIWENYVVSKLESSKSIFNNEN
jgi:hypothetical protein